MAKQPQSNSWVGILGALAIIIAALIGLGLPFAERIADRYIPSNTPIGSTINNTETHQPLIVTQTLPSNFNQVSQDECDPSGDLGLIELNRFTEPPWSRGIWGSENMKSLIVENEEIGIIDTRDTDITEIQIWISPCEGLHGFINGDRFWPLTLGIQSNSPPIYLGQLTIITIKKDTGRWALGKR